MSTLISKSKSTKSRSNKPSPRNREAKKETTRQAILRAALALFAQKGFHETTTRAISRKAKIAKGTLFNYFQTKEDLALYFFEQELSGVSEWYQRDKRAQKAALPEKLFSIIHRFLDRLNPYEKFINAVYLHTLQPSSKLSPLNLQSQKHNLHYLRFIREILNKTETKKKIPKVKDIDAYAFGIFHLAMITYWLQDHSLNKEQTLALLDQCLK